MVVDMKTIVTLKQLVTELRKAQPLWRVQSNPNTTMSNNALFSIFSLQISRDNNLILSWLGKILAKQHNSNLDFTLSRAIIAEMRKCRPIFPRNSSKFMFVYHS